MSATTTPGPARTAEPVLLQPLSFPLRGSRLIEASAGTGKTYTIAALYLRLVLGHGGEAAFSRPLMPPEILVVTFTEAATQELRDRIRARLAEAADAFLADPAEVLVRPPGEDLLHDLRAAYPPSEWAAHARTLRLAAEWMDEAAISTIHGWCNRMLSEHAFDSGALFTQALEADQRDLYAQVARDYWRVFFTPLPPAEAAQVRTWWRTPDDLLAVVEKLLGLAEALGPGLPPAQALAAASVSAERILDELKAPWRGETGWAAALLAGLDAAVAARQCKMPKRKDWCQALREWAEGDARLPALTRTAWDRLCAGGLAQDWSGDRALLAHPALQALDALRARVAALPDGRDDVLRHATRWMGERLAAEQARHAQMGFNELLTRLDAALRGPNGARLAGLIRRQFPVALIDEFQDTDPLQYRIFDTIYRVAGNDQDTAIVLIGDPKQAIYAFRGADIHTYLRARRDTEGRHATLGVNFRATESMVTAVNRLFLRAESRESGRGAFLFRDGSANPLPFVAVQARGRDDRWQIGGADAPALTCWTLEAEAPMGVGEAQQRFAQACATGIVRRLNEGRAGQAGFAAADGSLRPVRPGDIAVLVNSGREARAVRAALAARGVRSVYLSDKDSVFQTPAAEEMQRWLMACAEPDDDRPLRAALGSAALALDWAALDRLNHDELHWERQVVRFRQYQQIWRRQGVLPMVRRLLHDFGVPQRLLAAGDERTLTDLLHLAELLQQASARIDGEHALVRWLAEQRRDGGESEARKLRLESDADLVKVVTVHKSKGLEYPLVFLPFASAFRAARPTDLPLAWHDQDGRLEVALQPDAQALARVDDERLGEDLRKLYVALTRARYATWIGVAPLADLSRGALGYLLGAGGPLPPAALADALQALAQDCPAIAVAPAPVPDDTRFQAGEDVPVPADEPVLPQRRESWWIASYTALARTMPGQPETAAPDLLEPAEPPQVPASPASAAEDIYADSRYEAHGAADSRGGAAQPAPGSLHAFARGAGPGSFLHGLLEWVGRQGFAQVRDDEAVQADLADLIARRCNLSGWSEWIAPLRAWILEWVRTPWRLAFPAQAPGQGPVEVVPAALRAVQVEMEFWFSVSQAETQALDQAVRRHTLDGAPRAALLPQTANGMLKGYIDLVFEHDGRYYVADYKSNWLGPRDADYGPDALRAAVLAHRYDVQYALYLFALHRLLQARLPGYDYDRHVGGAIYLFLRGHAAPGQGLHVERPPRALIEALETLFQGTRTPPSIDDVEPA